MLISFICIQKLHVKMLEDMHTHQSNNKQHQNQNEAHFHSMYELELCVANTDRDNYKKKPIYSRKISRNQ